MRFCLLLVVLLGWLLPAPVTAEPKPCRHIILLDISGSLRTRGYATREGWTPILPTFLSKLFALDEVLSASGDDVQVCPFSDGVTDAKEGRHPVGPFAISQFKDHLEDIPFPGGGATDMPRALNMGNDLGKQSPGRTLFWLITDNENNMDDNQDDKEFYRRLRDSEDYGHVMFFPLADPKVRPGDNLVMYLMAPKGQWETPEIEKIAQAVNTKTGFEGILFRPLYTAPGASALDFSKELSLEGRLKHRVTQEGGTTVLHYQEGEKLDGQLRFRIRSRLKGWKLQKAHLEDAEVSLEIPHMYSGKGNQKTHWPVTPKELTVEPQKESAEFYLLHLSGPDNKPLILQRSTAEQLSSPFETHLPEIRGKVSMKAKVDLTAEGIKTEIPAALRERLSSVQNLPEIEHFMTLQQDSSGTPNDPTKTQREIQWERQLVVRVEADSTPAFVLAGLLGLGVLLGLAVVVAVVMFKHSFQLEGPGVDEEIRLPYIVGNYLACDKNGKSLFWLRSRWGGLNLVAEPDHAFAGDAKLLPVRWEGDEFRFELSALGQPTSVFWLRRQARGGGKADSSGSSPL